MGGGPTGPQSCLAVGAGLSPIGLPGPVGGTVTAARPWSRRRLSPRPKLRVGVPTCHSVRVLSDPAPLRVGKTELSLVFVPRSLVYGFLCFVPKVLVVGVHYLR